MVVSVLQCLEMHKQVRLAGCLESVRMHCSGHLCSCSSFPFSFCLVNSLMPAGLQAERNEVALVAISRQAPVQSGWHAGSF